MAGIVLVFIFLDKASIYAFLDLAFDLVDPVLWGQVLLSRFRWALRSITSALPHRACWRSCTSYQETGMLLGEGLAPGT